MHCCPISPANTEAERSARHFQKFSDLLEVFTEDLFFPRVAKDVCRMKRCQGLSALKVVEPAADFRDALFDSEQGPDGGRAEAADKTGPDHRDLPQQKRRAHLDFVRQRRTITRRAAFYNIADIDFLALHSNKLNHPIQQLAGASDKWQSLGIFVSPRAFADKNELSVRISLAKNNRVSPSGQPATMTIAKVFSDHFERFIFSRGSRR